MSSGSGNGDLSRLSLALPQPRPPRNLQDLLRYATEAGENSNSNNNFAPLDPDRRRFLEEALQNMTVDIAKELSEAIKTLKTLQNTESEQLSESEYVAALDKIADFVDNVDAANDYFKLGGFDIVNTCLASSSASIRLRMADIVAQCTQNNPFCQRHAVQMNFLQPLSSMVDQDEDSECKSKALFAVSSIVRDFPDALDQFKKYDGFFVILRSMKSPIERLWKKAVFFIYAIIGTNPEIKEIIIKMGFIEQLLTLIKGPYTSSHEHMINTLLVLAKDSKDVQDICRKPEFELKLTLQNIVNEFAEDESYKEELEYTKNLMAVVFSGQ